MGKFIEFVTLGVNTSWTKYYIGYSNFRSIIDKADEKVDSWLDEIGCRSDFVKVISSLKREQKIFHINLFCRNKSYTEEHVINCAELERPFNPQILLSTSGAANAGINNYNCYDVFRFDFSPSIKDDIQEESRAGRRVDASLLYNTYAICVLLESILSLIRRILISNNTTKEFNAILLTYLHITKSVFILPKSCIRYIFLHKASNPFLQHTQPLNAPCLACSYCLGGYNNMFPKVSRNGLTRVLLDIFMGPNRMQGAYTISNNLLKAIVDYRDGSMLIFRKKSKLKP